jgi:hypothetical protein
MKTTIYCISHKEVNINLPKNYKMLYVGNHFNKPGSDLLFDNTGNNISEKNKNYCELTGLYWMWKNTTDDIVGLIHYRRAFVDRKKNCLSSDAAEKWLTVTDFIVPKKLYFKKSIKQNFISIHSNYLYSITRSAIETLSPVYLEAFDKTFSQKHMYPYNMYICSKEQNDKYCEWLFKILFFIEEKVDLSVLDDYQKRWAGFISERLFNVWLNYNRSNVKECRVIRMDLSSKENLKAEVKNELLKLVSFGK